MMNSVKSEVLIHVQERGGWLRPGIVRAPEWDSPRRKLHVQFGPDGPTEVVRRKDIHRISPDEFDRLTGAL